MINEIQPKIKFQTIVQCPFKMHGLVDEVQSKCHKDTYFFNIIFFISEHLSSATNNDRKYHMWHLCRYLRKPVLSISQYQITTEWQEC